MANEAGPGMSFRVDALQRPRGTAQKGPAKANTLSRFGTRWRACEGREVVQVRKFFTNPRIHART